VWANIPSSFVVLVLESHGFDYEDENEEEDDTK